MTVSPSRASEILSAYGADPARWPEEERAACSALIERVPSLGYERRLAAALDAAVIGWAREPVVQDAAAADRGIARAMAELQAAARAQPRMWMGALAAALVAGVAVVGSHSFLTPPAPAETVAERQNDAAVFRTVFVPTQDEEDVLS